MLFADTAALGALGLILLAVAIVAFIIWLAVGTRDPDFSDVLKWVVAGAIGVILIAYAGSWHEVAIDPAIRRVTERHGYLGYELHWMGQQCGFRDFTTVLVERTTSKEATDNPVVVREILMHLGRWQPHALAGAMHGAALRTEQRRHHSTGMNRLWRILLPMPCDRCPLPVVSSTSITSPALMTRLSPSLAVSFTPASRLTMY